MNKRIGLILSLVFVVVAISGAIGVSRILNERYPWIWNYIHDEIRPVKDVPVKGPKHILFAFTDHFEPHDQETMDRWIKTYPAMADQHSDADGRNPQHSFFWFFSHSDINEKKSFLKQASRLVYEGYGEIELHMHHGNDTEETFLKQMNEAIDLSHEVGAMITQETQPRSTFGFIHGMWGLDNSRGPGDCGINNELILLRRLGCYADFTNPSWGVMHPKIVNHFYYATDDPQKPKSYDTGTLMEVGKPGVGDLFMFTGQSIARFEGLKVEYDHGEIDKDNLPTPERIDRWVKKAVPIKGRPEWIFIKVFAHSAIEADHEATLGRWRDRMHDYLEMKYNDGANYVLHYVTAREAYNIAKAAESGKSGNPNDFRDFVVPPYVNRLMFVSHPYEVISVEPEKAVIKISTNEEVEIRLHGKNVSVSGDAKVQSIKESNNETVIKLLPQSEGMVGLTFKRLGKPTQ